MRAGAVTLLLTVMCLSVPSAASALRAPERWPLSAALGQLDPDPLCSAEMTAAWTPAGAGPYSGRLGVEARCRFDGSDLRGTCGVALLDPAGSVVQEQEDWLYRDTDPCTLDAIELAGATAAGHRARITLSVYVRGPGMSGPTTFCPFVVGGSAECQDEAVLTPGVDQALRYE